MPRPKNRGNGQGSVYKEGKGWTAAKTICYEDGSRYTVKKRGFPTKKAGIDYLPFLSGNPKTINTNSTFKQLAKLMIENHEKNDVSKSTIDCYKAALKYFAPIEHFKFKEIGIEDLQECLDDCPKGKRTKQNMKVACGLVYKYAIPRGYTEEKVNLGEYLRINAEDGEEKPPFTLKEVEIFRKNCDVVPYAKYIYAMCYLGFRPSEFLSLTVDNYDPEEKAFVGGAKTEAGKNRTVTISPKIQPIIDELIASTKDGYIFHKDGHKMGLKTFREKCFYPALDQMGIPNRNPKRTPHSCRHTFANLMKNIKAANIDKMKLIGHSSEEMLRYYQSVSYDDLRYITDRI